MREKLDRFRGEAARGVLRHIMVLPACAAGAAVVAVSLHAWCLLGLCLLASLLGGRRLCFLTVAFAFVAGGLHGWRLEQERETTRWLGAQVDWRVVVSDEVRLGREGREVLVEVREEAAAGESFYLRLPWMEHELQVGDEIDVSGHMEAPREPMNPEEWDERRWLEQRGVHAVIVAQEVNLTGEVAAAKQLQRRALEAREWIGKRITAGLDDGQEAKIIRAMFLGERPRGEKEMVEDFRLSGTIHVFAVSGLHVMMIGSFVAIFLRWCGVPRKVWVWAVIVVMFSYAMVTGMRPPAMRAAVMGSILVAAWLVARRPVLGNSVALGALVAMLWDGHVVFLPGFQLSFAVLTSIVVTTGFFHKWFSWIQYTDPFLPRPLFSYWQEISLWVRRKICGAFTVGGSAWLGSAPLMFWHFGIVTPVSVLASVPLVFLAFFIMALCCASLCLGLLWPSGGESLNRVNAWQAAGAKHLASGAADVPGGYFTAKEWQSGERVVVYSLQGGSGSTYIGIGGGVLLDAGDLDSFYREVWPSLRNRGAAVDSLIATHADSRHCGGFEAALDYLPMKQGLLPDEGESRGALSKLLAKMRDAGVRVVRAEQGAHYPLTEDSFIEMIYAPGDVGGLADDRCLVLRLHWKDKKILFLNDAGFEFERWAREQQVDVQADVLVMGKHRRDASGTWGLLDRVAPRAVIATEAGFPAGESRGDDWYRELEQRGIEVYRQDVYGAVTMELENGELRLKPYREVK